MSGDPSKIIEAVKTILAEIGEDVSRPGLVDTPARVARALEELSRGYNDIPHKITLFPSGFSGVIFRSRIPFSSICEHHLLPFAGTIDFAYIPNGHVVGISKIIRLFRHFSARLTMQEDLTELLARKFMEIVKPKGCAIRISALHNCESARGVLQNDVPTTTFLLLGIFSENQQLADQFMRMLGKN